MSKRTMPKRATAAHTPEHLVESATLSPSADYRDYRLIRMAVVVDLTALQKSTIYNLIDGGDFPPPVVLSNSRVAWVEREVLDWIAQRVVERNKHSARQRAEERRARRKVQPVAAESSP